MNVQSNERQLAKDILCEFMKQFQKRNPNLHVFSSHLHLDEQMPHIHIDFVPFICNSKRGLEKRVSLKGALWERGFKGGTRGMTEWNEWIEAEKQERHFGREQVQSIVERSKALEQTERAKKRPKRAFEMSR